MNEPTRYQVTLHLNTRAQIVAQTVTGCDLGYWDATGGAIYTETLPLAVEDHTQWLTAVLNHAWRTVGVEESGW